MRYIGNPNCRYNARSPYLRCALNPDGPCAACPDYAKASLGERLLHPVQAFDTNNGDRALRCLISAFAGVQIGVLLAGFVIIPIMEQVLKTTAPAFIRWERINTLGNK
jgi:Family of unknown function (DUF6464)